MMVWGNQCTTWDDSVDLANLEAFDFGDIQEKDFVVTTWHPSEPLEDAFWIAKNFSFHFYDVELDNTIILHVSDSSRSDELLEMYANA